MEHEILKVINNYYDAAARSCCTLSRNEIKIAAFNKILDIVESYVSSEVKTNG